MRIYLSVIPDGTRDQPYWVDISNLFDSVSEELRITKSQLELWAQTSDDE